jgi:hypothetical protein
MNFSVDCGVGRFVVAGWVMFGEVICPDVRSGSPIITEFEEEQYW